MKRSRKKLSKTAVQKQYRKLRSWYKVAKYFGRRKTDVMKYGLEVGVRKPKELTKYQKTIKAVAKALNISEREASGEVRRRPEYADKQRIYMKRQAKKFARFRSKIWKREIKVDKFTTLQDISQIIGIDERDLEGEYYNLKEFMSAETPK